MHNRPLRPAPGKAHGKSQGSAQRRGFGGSTPLPAREAGRFFSIRQVSELLLVSERTVRRWIAREKLKKYQFGATIRIAASDLISFITRARRGRAPVPARYPLSETFFTVGQIAEVLSVCKRTVHRRIDRDVLASHDFDGITRIADGDLRDFIDRSRSG